MSGRLRPVTLLSVNPVPFCFANDSVWLPSGAAGFSVQARPSTSGIASAAKRRFMGHYPFVVSGGHKARRPPGAAAVVSALLARTFNYSGGRSPRPAAKRRAETPYYVLPLLFNVSTLIFALRIRAGAIALPFLLLHRARLVRPRLPRVVRVESH